MNQQLEAPVRIQRVVPKTPVVKALPPKWLVLTAFASVYLIWGSTYLGIHIAIQSIPPLFMAGGRFVIAGTLLYTVMRLRGAPRPDAGHWASCAVIGALLLVGGNGAITWAQKTVPTNIAALFVAATPLWMNLFDWLRPRGTRPRFAVVCGLVLGFVGVAFIVMSKDHLGNRVVAPLGAIVLVAANITWALGSIYSKYARQPASALLAVAMQMICGGVLLVLSGTAMGEMREFHPGAITASSLAAFVYLTLVGSLIAFTAYVWLLQVSTPARVATYAYVNPLIAVLLGRLVLNEPFPKSLALAAGLILGAVVLTTAVRRKQRRSLVN
jgi:drug/metabolite transporter (DMT)-like permease